MRYQIKANVTKSDGKSWEQLLMFDAEDPIDAKAKAKKLENKGKFNVKVDLRTIKPYTETQHIQ